MEGIDHIYIVQVGGSRFIGQIYRMLQRDIPDGERLEFRIACMDPPFMLMIELGKAGCHLSASRPGSRYDYQRTGGLYVFVPPIPFVAYDKGDIAGISLDGIMDINTDAHTFQLSFKGIGAVLSGVLGDHYASHKKASAPECIDKAENINVVGDPQISSDLVLLNISGADHDDDLRMIGKLH